MINILSSNHPAYSYLEIPKSIVHHIRDKGLQPIVVITTIAETIFLYFAENNQNLSNKAHKSRSVIFITHFAVLVYSIKDLYEVSGIKKNFPKISVNFDKMHWTKQVVIGVIGGVIWGFFPLSLITVFFIGYFVVNKLNQWVYPKMHPEDILEGIEFSWKKPGIYTLDQMILVYQQIIYLALSIFSKSHLTFAALSSANLYSLYQITKPWRFDEGDESDLQWNHDSRKPVQKELSQSLLTIAESYLSNKKTLIPRDKLSITKEVKKSTLSIKFDFQALFFPKEGPAEECTICLDTPEKSYYICTKHAHCMPCLTNLFMNAVKEMKIINRLTYCAEDDKIIKFGVCLEQDMLPRCTQRCKTIWHDQLFIRITNEKINKPSQIFWVDYQPDQKIKVKINALKVLSPNEQAILGDGTFSIAQGSLKDGTVVSFYNVEANRAKYLIQNQTEFEACIINKVIENGTIYLKCDFKKYKVHDEFKVKILYFKTIQGFHFAVGRLEDGTSVFFENLSDEMKDFPIGEPISSKVNKVKEDCIYCTSEFITQKESFSDKYELRWVRMASGEKNPGLIQVM